MLAKIWKTRWPLLAFALSFQLLENLLFTPAMGVIGRVLQGRPVLDSTALVQFFLSPRGFVVLFLGATMSLTIRLVENAGLSTIVLGSLEGKTFRALATFRWLLTELPRLARIGARIVGLALLTVAPLLILAGLLARPLLASHDINYYLANRTPEFVTTGILIGVAAVATLGLGLWLLVRWRLVVQTCMFDRLDGNAAFREANVLSHGVRWKLTGRCLAVLGFQLVLLLAAAGLQQALVWLVLSVAGLGQVSLAVSLGLLILLRGVVGAFVTLFGACAEAAVFTSFYRKLRLQTSGTTRLGVIEPEIESRRAVPGWAQGMAVAVVLGLLAAAGFSVGFAIEGLAQEGTVTVTAHRGAHHRAPENTLAAMSDAIAVGADYAEIDVQLTKDDVLVVTHDSDFSRLGGVAKKVWDLTYAEIQAIPLGAKSDPEFRGECAPTFEDLLALVRNRIRLNIELKYYGGRGPKLAERVVQALQSSRMTNQVIIQCLEYEPLMEVRRLAPEIPIGYLMSVNATHPGRLKVNFLGAEQGRATGSFVQAAHRRGQRVHVWTVNTTADMDRMIDLGVDDLITDRPEESLRCVRAYRELSGPERQLRRVRAWLSN